MPKLIEINGPADRMGDWLVITNVVYNCIMRTQDAHGSFTKQDVIVDFGRNWIEGSLLFLESGGYIEPAATDSPVYVRTNRVFERFDTNSLPVSDPLIILQCDKQCDDSNNSPDDSPRYEHTDRSFERIDTTCVPPTEPTIAPQCEIQCDDCDDQSKHSDDVCPESTAVRYSGAIVCLLIAVFLLLLAIFLGLRFFAPCG